MTIRRPWTVAISLLITVLLLLIGAGVQPAFGAGVGTGGGTIGGGSSGTSSLFVDYRFHDAAVASPAVSDQGTGQASIDWFMNDKDTPASLSDNSAGTFNAMIQSSCVDALRQASQRGGYGDDVSKSRAVGILWAYSYTTSHVYAQARMNASRFYDAVDQWVDEDYPGFSGASYDSVADDGQPMRQKVAQMVEAQIKQTGDESLADGSAYPAVSVICVALNLDEPPAQDYDLTVTTQASPQTLTAGTTTPIVDTLTASNGGSSIVETINTDVILHYDTTSKSTTVAVASNGTQTASFTPDDFGWPYWPVGSWWFDVHVAKQGKMSTAFDAPDKQPSESGTVTPPSYNLGVTTKATISDVAAGTTASIGDLVSATVTLTPPNASNSFWADHPEKLEAQVVAHYTGYSSNGKTYVPAATTAKSFTMTNTGDTPTPTFAPADFGFRNGWLPGGAPAYYFEVIVAQQGDHMRNAVDVNKDGHDKDEAVTTPYMPCDGDKCDSKTVEKGVSADSMTNTTTISHTIGTGVFEVNFRDTFTTNGNLITVSKVTVTDTTTGTDLTSTYTLDNPYAAESGNSADTTVTLTQSTVDPAKLLPAGHVYTITLDVTAHHPNGKNVEDTSTVNENNTGWSEKNTGSFPTWTFTPDKVWVTHNLEGDWAGAIDPDWTNTVAGDGKTLLNGAPLGVVVNGVVPADLIQAPRTLQIVDDYTSADYLWTPTRDLTQVKVYTQDVTTGTTSSVGTIITTGTDVTGQGKVTADPTTHTVTFTFNSGFLASLQHGESAMQVTMLIPGAADYANKGTDTPTQIAAGNTQALVDFGKTAGDELAFCTNPTPTKTTTGTNLVNKGSQQVNQDLKPTNQPTVCGYIPPVVKDVLSDPAQGGDQLSIDGKTVTPGQVVQYKLTTTPRHTPPLGYAITGISIDDSYSPWTTPVKTSIIVTDHTLGILPLAYYQVAWDEPNHTVTITLTKQGVAALLKSVTIPRFTVTFEARVNDDTPAGTVVDNEWTLIVDNSRIDSNIVTNPIPDQTPEKSVTSTLDRVSVNGKTFLVGEKGIYWITLHKDSMSDGKNAYPVQQFGMIDTPDTEVLAIDPDSLRVLAPDGTDVTSKFQTLWDGTTWWVAARLQPTLIPALGKTIDPPVAVTHDGTIFDPNTTPTDLPGYLTAGVGAFDSLATAVIDQSLIDGSYLVGFDFTVATVSDRSVVNHAAQILNGMESISNLVANPIRDLDPTKDVVVNIGDTSSDGATIIEGSTFLYALNSSILPPDRVYQEKTRWQISDQFDISHDSFTGQWAVYASRDLYSSDGTALLAQQGTRIAGSGYEPTSPDLAGLFTLDYTADGLATITATPAYLALISADTTHEAGFTCYMQMLRISVGDVTNMFTETIDDTDRPSNQVTTHTPDQTPSISLEKYDLASGVDVSGDEGKGNRDTPEAALPVTGEPIGLGYLITNTGAVPLTSLTLTDTTITGNGTVSQMVWPEGWNEESTLEPGESITVTATLSGVTTDHTNIGTVTAIPILACPMVDDNPWDDNPAATPDGMCTAETLTADDPWNATIAPPIPGVSVETGGTIQPDTGTPVPLWALLGASLLMAGGVIAGVVFWRRRRKGGR